MQLKIAGVDYRNSPLSVREKFTFTAINATEFLTKVRHITDECVLICTCNRTELVIISDKSPIDILRKERCDADFFFYEGEEAVTHLYEVAAGLCSQVPLEDQILGQIKDAYTLASTLKCTGKNLNKLFLSIISAGKEVRTAIKQKANNIGTSVAQIALKKAIEHYGSLTEKKCLIIGSGETGMLCADIFSQAGCNVVMTIRRHRRDNVLPQENVATIKYDDRYIYAQNADIIIGATSSPHSVFTADTYLENNHETLILDLAVPRDIDKNISKYANVTIHDMDTLGCPTIKPEFKKQVSEIIEKHKKDFNGWMNTENIMPIINSLCDFAALETTRQLENITTCEKQQIEEASRNMMKKFLFSIKNKVNSEEASEFYRTVAKVAKQ